VPIKTLRIDVKSPGNSDPTSEQYTKDFEVFEKPIFKWVVRSITEQEVNAFALSRFLTFDSLALSC
jgi:hypothetical protein